MSEEFLACMKKIAFEGGKIALKLISKGTSSHFIKPDNSILTEADIKISELSHRVLGDLVKTTDHILIDEEDKENSKYIDESFLKKSPYIWVIDPIDGTRSYSNHMPHFGISIGLIKDLKPYLGLVYFPMLGDLFYSDSKQSFFVQNPFSENEKISKINPIDQKITSQSEFICCDSFFKAFEWNFSDCHIMSPNCAALSLCWPAVGRGCGAFFGSRIWDFAGSWPIFLSAKLSLRSYYTGNEITSLDVELFDKEGDNIWKLKDFYILSSKRNFPLLKKRITPKS